MATNWSAYEAAKELYGDNKENIQDIGSRFPLFARTVMAMNSEYLLDILKAIPKVSARVVETGMKGEVEETDSETKETKETKTKVDKTEDGEVIVYETMSAKELYALCCERGISSMCKSRKKEALIELLEKLDNGEIEPTKKSGKTKDETKEEVKAPKGKGKKKAEPEPEEDESEDWDEEEEDEKDPYEGKTAKELYKMCIDRGIKTKMKLSADEYVKLLKKADAEESETDDEDEDDDEWEI